MINNVGNKTLKIIRNINDCLLILIFSLLAGVVLVQVVFRYAFQNPLSWTEEVARYLQIWMVLLGSALAMRTGAHLAIDILTASLPPKIKKVFDLLIYVIMICFLLIITVYGFELTMKTVQQTSPAMQMPMSFAYASFPVGGGLMLLEASIKLSEIIKK